MVAYDIPYTWQWVLAGLSPGTVMAEIFNHEPPIAYNVLIQYLWAYVDEVQTANYYYSKTQYFQHIKDEYGQYTYDVLVGKFIHLSNQFNDMFALTEWHMYGSSRLGVHKPMSPLGGGAGGGSTGRQLVHIEFEGTWNQYTHSFTDTGNTTTTTYQMSYDYFTLTRGEKNYEMVNHLGNVLVIISDKKLKTCEGDTVNYYMADVLQATDYSAFHATLKDRVWYANAANKYRFGGSNGQERDDEVSGEGRSYSAEFWQYSPDLGRRFNVDPKPVPSLSVYSCFANNPLFFTDVNGDSAEVNFTMKSNQDAFNEFFNTAAGRSYVGKYAAKGQTINGYTFTEDGVYHKKRIDLKISDKDLGSEKLGLTDDGSPKIKGKQTGLINGRLKIDVFLNTRIDKVVANSSYEYEEYTNFIANPTLQSRNALIASKAMTLTHELMIHAEFNSMDFIDGGFFDNSYTKGHSDHHKFQNSTYGVTDYKIVPLLSSPYAGELYNTQGVEINKQIHRKLGVKITDKKMLERMYFTTLAGKKK